MGILSFCFVFQTDKVSELTTQDVTQIEAHFVSQIKELKDKNKV